jgi:hypothetical protein
MNTTRLHSATPRRTHRVRSAPSHTWEVVTPAGRVLGRYARADYRVAVRDAAILSQSANMQASVRRAV